MKKILHISGSSSPIKCGVGYYTETLLEHLGPKTASTVLTSAGSGIKFVNVDRVLFSNGWKTRDIRSILKKIEEVQPDIIHIQYPAVGYKRQLGINLLPLMIRLRFRKLDLIITLHEYYESAILGRIRNLVTVWFAKKIIVSNQLDKDSLPRYISRKTTIIPIGSNISKQKQNRKTFHEIIKVAGFDSNEPTLAYFGFPNRNKGLDVLLKSAPKINAQLLLLTNFDKNDSYQAYLSDLYIKARKEGAKIHIAGSLDDERLSEVLQECRFFLLPQPNPLTAKSGTAIAAVSHGLPVISKAHNNPVYNLPYKHKENAILINDSGIENFAKICNKLLLDKKLSSKLINNLLPLQDYFSWENIVKKHLELYKK